MPRKSLWKTIINSLSSFITNEPMDAAISNVVKDSAPITVNNYKTIIDVIKDVKSKISTETKPFEDRFTSSIQQLLESGNLTAQVSSDRINRYKTYDSMVDNIPLVKRGLWIWTENILSPDDILKVAIKFEPIKPSKKDLQDTQLAIDHFKNIMESLHIDELLEEVVFDTMKYGDSFIEIQIADEEFRKVLEKKHIDLPMAKQGFTLEYVDVDYGSGIKNKFRKAIHLLEDKNSEENNPQKRDYSLQEIILIHRRPHNIIKLETRQLLLGYLYIETSEDSRQTAQQLKTEINMGEIVTKIATDITSFLRQYKDITIDEPYIKKNIASVLKLDEKLAMSRMQIRFIPPDRMIHFKIPSSRLFPYGESWLSGLEFDARLYLTDKVATVVHRVARAGERRVVYVETGVDNDVQKYIERAKNQLIKKEVAWNDTNDINAIPSAVTPFETIYIPRRNGQAFMEIESLTTGEPISDRMQTNQELKESLVNGLSLPNNLLGASQWEEQRADLTQQNITFVRLVIGLQKKFTEYTTELFQKIYRLVYLDSKDYSPMYDEIRVTFNPPQNILLESISNTYTSVANIAQTLETFGVPKEMIAKKFMPDLPWDEIEKQKQIQSKNSEEDQGY